MMENIMCNDDDHISVRVENHDHLWHILNAANGDVVADLKHQRVGARPFIRIVDGKLECKTVTFDSRTEDTLNLGVKDVEMDIDMFESIISTGDKPVFLVPAKKTPFEPDT